MDPNNLDAIWQTAQEEIPRAASPHALAEAKAKFVGRQGVMTKLIKALPTLAKEARRERGQALNALKEKIEELVVAREEVLTAAAKSAWEEEALDVTRPPAGFPMGRMHVVTQTLQEISRFFVALGYQVVEGPEVETDYYNFEALNIPADHPAREMHDTFYLTGGKLLRTHTSPVQIHVMERHPPPLAVIAQGRVYRRDADATHSPVFHQVEGLLVAEQVTFGQLKGTLVRFLRALFGGDRAVRFRPSYFPFTEPSAEVDVRCGQCGGKGCGLCKGTGWLEILGAGMVDPNVFRAVGYDPERVTGFAFGLGVERIAMLKYGISDIRLFYENDARFVRQF